MTQPEYVDLELQVPEEERLEPLFLGGKPTVSRRVRHWVWLAVLFTAVFIVVIAQVASTPKEGRLDESVEAELRQGLDADTDQVLAPRPDSSESNSQLGAVRAGATGMAFRTDVVLPLGNDGSESVLTAIGTVEYGGLATWYCGGGSRCPRGYDPLDSIAAIDPSTGIRRGAVLRVTSGSRSVVVRVVDTCACGGARIIDLSRLAFSRLADPSRGVIPVTIAPADVAPQTDSE